MSLLYESWEQDADKWGNQPWVSYEGIHVVRRCLECGRYITEGKLYMDFNERPIFEGWICKVHGEVDPYWLWHE